MSRPAPDLEGDPRVQFVLRMGEALQVNGAPSFRLEAALRACCERLGVEGQFFAAPTSLLCAFGRLENQAVRLLRIDVGEVDIGRLTALDRLLVAVTEGRTRPEEGVVELERLRAVRGGPPAWVSVLAFGAAAAGAARLFGGGWVEIGVAGVASAGIGLLALARSRSEELHRLFEALAALLVAVLVAAAGGLVGPFATNVATVASLIVLVPGFTLTVAVTELAVGHLASGTARLMGAATRFLQIAVGVALGRQVAAGLGQEAAPVAAAALPGWTMLAALVVAPLAFVGLFRVRPRDTGQVLVACWLGYGGSQLGTAAFGAALGPFVGAFALGLFSNAFARWVNLPSVITTLPALILLVPGSVGFRSLVSLMEKDTTEGLAIGFEMVQVAFALVTGLLLAGAVLPPRRAL